MAYVFAVLMFGFLIFVHELGHYLFARLFKVKINEFSIGMGPKIFTKTSKKTGIKYSLRWLPIGGYVSMAGEEEGFEDENALTKKPVWQRMIITVAGGITNIFIGALIMLVFVLASPLGSNVIGEFSKNAVSSEKLEIGDKVIEVNGTDVFISTDLNFSIMWDGGSVDTVKKTEIDGSETTYALMDLTVIRNGEKLYIEDVPFLTTVESGMLVGLTDFRVYAEHKSFSTVMKHFGAQNVFAVRYVWSSLYALVSGRVGVSQISGPVGVTEQVGNVAKTDKTATLWMMALIAINLGIVNLLPIPALDGGRFVFQIIEAVRRKPIKRDVEAKIHSVALLILLALMLIVTFKDVFMWIF